jgi:hypothetical protein
LTTTGSTGAATFVSNTLNIPSYTDQFVGTVTSVDLTAGTGITVSGGPITTSGSITVNNSDRGSSQNIFKNINVITSQDWDDSDFVWNVDDGSWSGGIDQEAIVADNNNDTLFIESIGGISITTDSTTDTIYFDNIDKGSEQNIFKNIAVSGQSTIVADVNDDTLTVASGTGISLTTNDSTDTLTITNSAPDQTVVLTAGTGITTSGTYPSFTVTNDDRGSSQNIFKNIAVTGQTTIVADTNDDTLTVVGGTGISVTTDHTTDTLTITNTATTNISCFSAYSSTGVTLTTSATAYNLNLDTETITNATVFTHSTSVNPEEVTVLLAGTYEISYSGTLFNANFNQTAAAVVDFDIYKNGALFTDPLNTKQNVAHVNVTNYNYINQISNSYIVSLSVNDVIKLVITALYQGGGSPSPAVNFGFVGSAKNNLTIKKLS